MSLFKRVIEKEPEGPDMLITLSFSGVGTAFSVKKSARGRAIAEAGLDIPSVINQREQITRVENLDLNEGDLPLDISGEITVRVRNAR